MDDENEEEEINISPTSHRNGKLKGRTHNTRSRPESFRGWSSSQSTTSINEWILQIGKVPFHCAAS